MKFTDWYKKIDILHYFVFAISASIFIFMGSISLVAAFAFPIFLGLGYRLSIPRIEINNRNRILIPVLFLISILRSRQIFYVLNNSNKMNILYTKLGIEAKCFEIKIVAVFLTLMAIILSMYSLLCMITLLPNKENNGEKYNSNKLKLIIVLLIISVLYTLTISVCSPLVKHIPGGDYSIFYIIGKMWSKGHLPYVELFDHKGPIIFFIYYLGIKISESIGIYLLQILSLWISLCLGYKIIKKDFKFDKYAVLAVVGILVFFNNVEFGYTLTEEFCLPFLMLSVLGIHRYFDNYNLKREHSPVWAGIYGMTFGICFYTRVTNAIVIVIWIVAIVLILAVNKKFRNLFANAAGFILGFLVVFLPFAIYFAIHDAFVDMLYGTVIYNVMYATGSLGQGMTVDYILQIALRTWPGWIYIILILLSKKANLFKLIHCSVAIVSMFIVTSGNHFGHYAIILAIFVPLNCILISEICSERYRTVNWKLIIFMLGAMIIVTSLSGGYSKMIEFINGHQESEYEVLSKKIVSYIPVEERDEIIGYNTKSLFYLYTDIVPCYKYYTLQDWQSGKSEGMITENVEFYNSKQAKWVVLEGEVKVDKIKSAIQNNYVFVHSEEGADNEKISLYIRKE